VIYAPAVGVFSSSSSAAAFVKSDGRSEHTVMTTRLTQVGIQLTREAGQQRPSVAGDLGCRSGGILPLLYIPYQHATKLNQIKVDGYAFAVFNHSRKILSAILTYENPENLINSWPDYRKYLCEFWFRSFQWSRSCRVHKIYVAIAEPVTLTFDL